MPRAGLLVPVACAIGLVGELQAGPTRIAIHAAPGSYGGAGYGGFEPLTGATISQELEVQLDGTGEIRVDGVAGTLDPGSVQLRDKTEPALAIVEQRFVPGARSPSEIVSRSVGERIVATTPKGEVTGTLRAADATTIVVETGGKLVVLRRDFVQELRVANAAAGRASLVWRVASKQAGTHALEVGYRTEGLAWTPDYLAVLDERARTIDFSALATIANTTGATFERAQLLLVSGAVGAPAIYGVVPRPPAPPSRYPIAQLITIAPGAQVQVALIPRRVDASYREVIAFEAMPDPSPSYQAYPNTDCAQFDGKGTTIARAELAAELDVPTTLPAGRVRLLRRTGTGTELASVGALDTASGVVRVGLGPSRDIVGSRKAIACKLDENARTLVERVEVKLTNRGRTHAEVVVREFAWRWPVFRLDGESQKSQRGSGQAQEYRVKLAAGASQTITYGLVYTW